MKAELKHLKYYLGHDLKIKVGNTSTAILTAGLTSADNICMESVISTPYVPIMRPLSSLIKEIEFEGEKFRPMFKLLQLVSKQQDILSETIEYSYDPEQKSYFIRVNYKGFFVILAFDVRDKSFTMIRNGKIFSINNQLEAFEWLYKWHFNIYEVESIDK